MPVLYKKIEAGVYTDEFKSFHDMRKFRKKDYKPTILPPALNVAFNFATLGFHKEASSATLCLSDMREKACLRKKLLTSNVAVFAR